MLEEQMCLLGHIPPQIAFWDHLGLPNSRKFSLPSREWELTFFRERDRDQDSRKCLSALFPAVAARLFTALF
jgi:hypothetical protein